MTSGRHLLLKPRFRRHFRKKRSAGPQARWLAKRPSLALHWLSILGLIFVCNTPQPFFLSFNNPFYHISLPRGLSLLYSVGFCPFISVFQVLIKRGPVGHYDDEYLPCPAPKPYDQQNYAQDPFSHPRDHQQRPLLMVPTTRPIGLFTRGSRSSRSGMWAMSLTKSPRNTRHDLVSSSFSHAVFTTSATGSLSAASRCFRAWYVL